MAFDRITDGDLQGKGNLGRPDTPGVDTREMQRILDELPREVIVPAFNRLTEQLEAPAAAASLGAAVPEGLPGDTPATVQGALKAISHKSDAHSGRTDNPHAVTAAQTGAYTKEETDAAIGQRVSEIGAGDMAKVVYDPQSQGRDVTVQTYTHTKSGTVHNFAGSGANGRAKMTANVQAGDTFTVNGAPATAYMGAESAAAAMAGSAWNGRWVSFVVDGATLNFKGGGGLSAADGAKLIPGNIKAGVTLFAGTPKQVVGTFTNDANAAASSIKQGVVAYSKGQRLVGALPPYGPQTITPTTRDQSFGPGVYLAGQINVKGDPNLVAGNIRQGVSIFGVTGALPVRAKPAILHAQSWASNSNFTELYSSDSFVKSQNNVWTCTKACRAQVVCIALSSGGHSTTSATAKGVVTTATVGDGGDYYSIVTNTQASQIFDFYPGDAVQVAHNCGYHTNTGIIVICPV